MIEIILSFIGCTAVMLLGIVIAFFSGLGKHKTAYFVGIGIFFAGIFFTAYEMSKVFVPQ